MFFEKKMIFSPRFFVSGLGYTGELWWNRIVLMLRNKEDFLFCFAEEEKIQKFGFKEKKVFFSSFSSSI